MSDFYKQHIIKIISVLVVVLIVLLIIFNNIKDKDIDIIENYSITKAHIPDFTTLNDSIYKTYKNDLFKMYGVYGSNETYYRDYDSPLI